MRNGTRLPRDRAVWLAFLGTGLLTDAVPFRLVVWGQTQIASGLAAFLNATTPLSTVVIAHLATADERMTGSRAVWRRSTGASSNPSAGVALRAISPGRHPRNSCGRSRRTLANR
nr:hypothetical protein [Methylobacterium sp. J-030]